LKFKIYSFTAGQGRRRGCTFWNFFNLPGYFEEKIKILLKISKIPASKNFWLYPCSQARGHGGIEGQIPLLVGKFLQFARVFEKKPENPPLNFSIQKIWKSPLEKFLATPLPAHIQYSLRWGKLYLFYYPNNFLRKDENFVASKEG